jgi:hypothetical protein
MRRRLVEGAGSTEGVAARLRARESNFARRASNTCALEGCLLWDSLEDEAEGLGEASVGETGSDSSVEVIESPSERAGGVDPARDTVGGASR